MVKVKVTTLKCKRCHHGWVPRTTNVTICPNCKSPYWNQPRRRR